MSDSKNEAQDIVRSLAGDYVPGEYWTHYKGGVYKIVALAVKEDTQEPVVVYQSLKYGTIWVRTIKNWCEKVPVLGGMVDRFKKGAP